jgi:hypothetical protein
VKCSGLGIWKSCVACCIQSMRGDLGDEPSLAGVAPGQWKLYAVGSISLFASL